VTDSQSPNNKGGNFTHEACAYVKEADGRAVNAEPLQFDLAFSVPYFEIVITEDEYHDFI